MENIQQLITELKSELDMYELGMRTENEFNSLCVFAINNYITKESAIDFVRVLSLVNHIIQ